MFWTRHKRAWFGLLSLVLVMVLAIPGPLLAQSDTDIGSSFPSSVAGEPVEVEVFSGPEWVERLVAGGMDETTATRSVTSFVEALDREPEDLTVAIALLEPSPGNISTISAIRVDGVRTAPLVSPAIEHLFGIEDPNERRNPQFGGKIVRRVRDQAVLGSYALTVYEGHPGTLWVVDAQKPIALDIVDALPRARQESRVPQFEVSVRWPENWRIEAGEPTEMGYEPGPSRMYVGLLGPDEAAWEVAYARPEGEGGDGECTLQLYEASDLTLDDIVDWTRQQQALGEGIPFELGEVRRLELPAGEAVLLPITILWDDVPMGGGVIVAVDGGEAVIMLQCGGDPASEHWPATAESIATTIEGLRGGPDESFAE